MDTTIIAGIIGALGALGGTLLGYKLNNSEAKLKAFIDNRIVIYYLRNQLCAYFPITVINEGSKSGTISDFKIELINNNQTWQLFWWCFSIDNTLQGGSWIDSNRASPILVHGNSGIQCPIKMLEKVSDSSQQFSNVLLSGGETKIKFEYYDRDSKKIETQYYSFNMATNIQEVLAERRKDHESLETVIIPLEKIGGGA